MKVGSLFSGAGCGDLGLEWAGFDHAWFCEVDPYARKILALRWPGKPIYEDIREVDFTKVESVDMLAGGFPCQDISIAGPGKGIEGERSGLWKEFARAIAEIRPRYALIENSPQLVNRGLDVVLSDLAASGYDAEWRCLPANWFGAWHQRKRIWIIAYRMRSGLSLPWPKSIGEDGEQSRRLSPPSDWWAAEPGVDRVVHGTPNRVDRIRCIGNGQLPHCTYLFGSMIMEHHQATHSKSVEEK